MGKTLTACIFKRPCVIKNWNTPSMNFQNLWIPATSCNHCWLLTAAKDFWIFFITSHHILEQKTPVFKVNGKASIGVHGAVLEPLYNPYINFRLEDMAECCIPILRSSQQEEQIYHSYFLSEGNLSQSTF